MITQKDIEKFLEPKKMAIAGVSRNPKKFSRLVLESLKKKGFKTYPINPLASEIEGEKCYSSVSDLPSDVKHLVILTPKKETDTVLHEAIKKGINNIWVQQMSETENTIKIAEGYQIGLISKKCIFMFTEPVTSIHKFHRTILKLFGRLPK
jgi:predicted CoA-binding protein